MKKLVFITGTMGSGKTHRLIKKMQYEKSKGNKCVVLKPSFDTREKKIVSRSGLECECHDFGHMMNPYFIKDDFVIFVDEAQFLSASDVGYLRYIAMYDNDVFCYGLKTNFKGELFEGSKSLLTMADETIELEHFCECGALATINAKLNEDGEVTGEGEVVSPGYNYKPLCYTCWCESLID